MAKLLDRDACSGCMACYNICPIKCISVKQDENGFYIPYIERSKCLNCGMCEKVCKKSNGVGSNTHMYGKAFTTNNSETLAKSSSGGAFTAIASIVLYAGGVVYGAAYDENFCVRHIRVNDFENLTKLNGSKYVQSDLQNCYELVKNDLKAGRKVLFSGTPCQVAGLVVCLSAQHRKNLLTIDFICHGVPAPKAWDTYLQYVRETVVGSIEAVNMRDHRLSQENFGLFIVGDKGSYFKSCANDPYLMAFTNNLILRKACYHCKYKKIMCHSDITLGDLWGGKDLLPAERYTGHHSLVIANSAIGATYLKELSHYGTVEDIPLEKALIVNSSRFYPSTKIIKTSIDDIIYSLGNGFFEREFADMKKKEALLSRFKRKITVLIKCFVLNKKRTRLFRWREKNESNDCMSMRDQ